MLALHELQQEFVKSLNHESQTILQLIKSDTTLSAEEHLEIYRSSIIGAFQKVLKEVFPVCHKLVGDEFFIALADEYIKQTPSTAPDIGDYGKYFAEFIATFPPAQVLPYLSDVANLEWAWHQIFSAPDHADLDFQKLAEYLNIAGDQITFLLPPKTFLLSSAYPIHRIWEVNQESFSGEKTIHLKENNRYFLMVWRHGLEMRIDELSTIEWQMLKWIDSGLTVGAICEQAATELPKENIVELLPHLVSRGWLVDFTLGEQNHVGKNIIG